MEDRIICSGVYLVAGPNVSHSEDATAFLLECGSELVMIDAGAGRTVQQIERAIRETGFDLGALAAIILTHCHIDHIGGAPYFADTYGAALVAHDLDADAIERGDPVATASAMYGVAFPPTRIDHRLAGDETILHFDGHDIRCIHAPGHTPGSMAVSIDRDGKRILFGQDIHGPFTKAFGSDIAAWKRSMETLLDLEADILCEGHFGIFTTKERVRSYIEGYLQQY